MHKASILAIAIACIGVGACADDLSGKYVGEAAEAIVGAKGKHDRVMQSEEVTIQSLGEQKLLVRYGSCRLPAFMSEDKDSASVSNASCDVHLGPYAGRVELFGSVGKSGSVVTLMANGNTIMDDGPATYTYQFKGSLRD